jgi:dihydroorotase
MRRALEYSTAFDMPLMITAIEPSLSGLCDEGYWSTRLGLPATPGAAETIAVSRDIALAKLTKGWLHLNRISAADTVALIAQAKSEGVRVTCDVAAHHLVLTSAAQAEFDTNTKVWPPLRSERDRLALIQGIKDGVIDAVVSDHQPHHAEDKAREYEKAAIGVSSVELAIPLLLQRLALQELTPDEIVRVVTSGPRRVLGQAYEGIRAGASANLTLIDPELEWLPSRETLLSRATNTPFLDQPLRGRAILTMVDGRVIWQHTVP